MFEEISAIIRNPETLKHQKLSLVLSVVCRYAAIPQTSYVILGSYAIRHYRQINDLDVDMLSEDWEKLSLATLGMPGVIIHSHPKTGEKIWLLDLTPEYQKSSESRQQEQQSVKDSGVGISHQNRTQDQQPGIKKLRAQNNFQIEVYCCEGSQGYPSDEFSLQYLIAHKQDMLETDPQGHYYYSLQSSLKWKKTVSRSKDIPDIQMINIILQAKQMAM